MWRIAVRRSPGGDWTTPNEQAIGAPAHWRPDTGRVESIWVSEAVGDRVWSLDCLGLTATTGSFAASYGSALRVLASSCWLTGGGRVGGRIHPVRATVGMHLPGP